MAFLHQNGIYSWCCTRRNIHPGTYLHVYIRMGSTRCHYHKLVPQGEIYTRDMAFLHVYIRMGPTQPHNGEIYTQGHGIPPYISEWDLHGAATSYHQLVPQGEYTPRDSIRMGSITVPPLATTSSLCHKGNNIPRDMAFLHVYQNGI
jgi:hypothetical protein